MQAKDIGYGSFAVVHPMPEAAIAANASSSSPRACADRGAAMAHKKAGTLRTPDCQCPKCVVYRHVRDNS